MGGAPYLHTLIASVPTAANAGYYARIVRERAILRRLVEVGTRIVQLGYSGDGDADELVDRAAGRGLRRSPTGGSARTTCPLSEIMPGALDEIEAIGSRGGRLTGVPTGFADLDALTNGLHPGQMIVIAARPAIGKALALDTPLPTPDGLDHDGRGPGRRPAARRRRQADPRRGGHRGHARAPVLRGGVRRRHGHRRRRRAPVADDHQGKPRASARTRRDAWYWPEVSRGRLRDAALRRSANPTAA